MPARRIACALLLVVALGASLLASGASGAKRHCPKKHEDAGCTLSNSEYDAKAGSFHIQAPHSYAYGLLELKCSDPNGGAHSVLFGNANPGQPGSQLLFPAKLKVGKTYTKVWHLDYPSLKGTQSVTVTLSSAKKAVVHLSRDSTQGGTNHCKGSKTLKLTRFR